MGKCSGRSMALLALTLSLVEITRAPVLEACVFPDQSVIDSFGIFYHARGIVRGVDLTTSFAYRSDSPPFVSGN